MRAWMACKAISKRMPVDMEDVCREVEITQTSSPSAVPTTTTPCTTSWNSARAASFLTGSSCRATTPSVSPPPSPAPSLRCSRCATGMVSSIGTLNQKTSYTQTSKRILLSSDVDLPIFFSNSCSNCKPLKANMEALIKLYNIFSTLFYYLIFHPCKMELTLLI